MLQWQLVFLFLIIEVFVCIVVVLPLPLKYRRSILKSIDSLTKHSNVSIVLKVIFLLLLLLFIDCIRSSMKAEEKLDHSESDHGHVRGHASHCEELSRLFRNQRNAYLTGFALFLFLMIYRLKEMTMSLIAIENRGAALISQGDQSQKEYKRVSDEKDKFKAEAESAKQKLKALEEEATKLRNSEKAIKQQADNQGKEWQPYTMTALESAGVFILLMPNAKSTWNFGAHKRKQDLVDARLLAENDELHRVANAKSSNNKKGD